MKPVNPGRSTEFLRRSRSKVCLAGLMLGLFVTLHAVSASQFLHHAVCDEAGAADHHCAVTLFAKGQIDCPVESVLILGALESKADSLPPVSPLLAPVDYAAPPGRAPPVSLP